MTRMNNVNPGNFRYHFMCLYLCLPNSLSLSLADFLSSTLFKCPFPVLKHERWLQSTSHQLCTRPADIPAATAQEVLLEGRKSIVIDLPLQIGFPYTTLFILKACVSPYSLPFTPYQPLYNVTGCCALVCQNKAVLFAAEMHGIGMYCLLVRHRAS